MKKILVIFFVVLFSTSFAFSQEEAKVVFYRPGKTRMAKAEFIIGAEVPDTVFYKLKNKSYYELIIKDIRDWEFVGGFYKITASQKIKIEADKTYYILCYIKMGFPTDKGLFKLMKEKTALSEMEKLKPGK